MTDPEDHPLMRQLRRMQAEREEQWQRRIAQLERGDLLVKTLVAIAFVLWLAVYLLGCATAAPPCPACPDCPPGIWGMPCIELDAAGNPFAVPCKLATRDGGS